MVEILSLIAHEKSNYIYQASGFENYDDLFAKISKIAKENSLVEDSYLNALLDREYAYPTGIVASRNIAIPHTENIHSKTNGIITVICNDPIKFSMMGNAAEEIPVEIVFFILSNEGNQHILQLATLMDLIQDEYFLEELVENNLKTIDKLLKI